MDLDLGFLTKKQNQPCFFVTGTYDWSRGALHKYFAVNQVLLLDSLRDSQ